MTYDELSDSAALDILDDSEDDKERELAATFLEVSINGGDRNTVESIALRLLGMVA